MDPALSFEYVVFVLTVTLTSLLMIVFGGWVKNRLQKGGLRFGFARKSRLHRKFFGFLLFIIAIFLTGLLSERLQSALFSYLKTNVATSITGICVVFLVAWILYDVLVWRAHNN